jgi:hypothetical protein
MPSNLLNDLLNNNELLRGLLFIGGLVSFALIAIALSDTYWERKLREWAESQNLKLIKFRGSKFYEGPLAFKPFAELGRDRNAFRVLVEDGAGKQHEAWVTLSSTFPVGYGVEDVAWDYDKLM